MDVERSHEIALAQEKERAEMDARNRAKELRNANSSDELMEQHNREVGRILEQDDKLVYQILRHWMSAKGGV
jgi:hypothetical protein